MKKLTIIMLCFVFMILTGCTRQEEKLSLDEFPHLTLEELDQKIADKESMVVYFGWTKNCGDSINFQDNYLLKEAVDNVKLKEVYIVDLDTELPEALAEPEKREPLIDTYEVLYSPTLIAYNEGMLHKLLAWTPATTDKNTGILRTDLDSFFLELGYIVETDKK